MNRIKEVYRLLEDTGHRLTSQRVAVIDYLFKKHRHISASDIFEELKNKEMDICHTSVYNTLDILQDEGAIKEIEIGHDYKCFDTNISKHHHVVCVKCGRIEDVKKEFRSKLMPESKVANQFKIIGHQILFYGTCQRCKPSGNA